MPLSSASGVDAPLAPENVPVAAPLGLPLANGEPLTLSVDTEPVELPVENAEPDAPPWASAPEAPDAPLDSVSCPVVPPFAQPNPIIQASETTRMARATRGATNDERRLEWRSIAPLFIAPETMHPPDTAWIVFGNIGNRRGRFSGRRTDL
jgi:hypothetical protein